MYYRISLPENDTELLQRRLFLASILEEKSSHSVVVVPSTDDPDEKNVKSSANDVKSPLRMPKLKAEPGCAPLSDVSDVDQTGESKTVVEEDVLLDLPKISEPSSQEMTKHSGSHGSKVSSVITTVAVTLPSSKPKGTLTTTAVHTASKVTFKSKYYNDVKKQPKSIKTPVPNLSLMTTSEKPSSNAIRSYLTISSILNEPEPKKLTLPKVARSSTVVKESSNDMKSQPAIIESSQLTTESTVSSNGSVEPLVVSPITSHSTSSSSITPAVTLPSVSKNEPKNSKSLSSPAKQLPANISTNVPVASSSKITAPITAEPGIILPIPAPTTVLSPSNVGDSPTSVPECTILANAKSPISSGTNVTTTNVSSITTTSGNTVCTKTVPCSVLVDKSPQDHATRSTASTISKTTVTNSTVSSSGVKVATSITPSSVSSAPPPLITLKPSPTSKASLPLLKPRPVQPSFILANTKIPSSLEISLTQSKNDRVAASNSPVLSLQKMVTQNFATNSNDTMAKCAIKRPFVDVDEPPAISISKAPSTNDEKKKLGVHNEITLTTNDSVPAKKIFSPNILPEVSITLNPHPDQPTKRIMPETSFDVTCFKPSEKPEPTTNGIPPLTPIAKYPAASSSICKNIQNSPIKNLNTKSLKNPQRNSFSPKNRPRPLLACDVEPKIRKMNGPGNEPAKQALKPDCATVEPGVNGAASPVKSSESVASMLCKPQKDAKLRIDKNSTCTAVSGSSSLKKEGSRHQSIPQLIDITTPRYTQLMAAAAAAQNAKMRSTQYLANNLNSTLHIKLPSADESVVASTGAALDLSSPSSCDKGCPTAPIVDKLLESPTDKKNFIQSMPPLMIPVTMSSRIDSKVSPSGQSLARIERRVSPITKMLDRKSDAPMTPSKGLPTGASVGGRRSGGSASDLLSRSVPFPTNGHSDPSASNSPSSRMSKTPPSNVDARRMSPSNSAGLLPPVTGSTSPLTPSTNFMSIPGAANYHATVLHLMRMQHMQQLQQNWLSKVRDPVPPHPLMFDHSKPSTSQESLFNYKK